MRLRKENQIISAEEKRSMVVHQIEEREKKEKTIVAELKALVNEKIRATEESNF